MKKSSYAIAALSVILSAAPVSAGVIITKKQTFSGVPAERVVNETLMIQGNKERHVIEGLVILTDLDARKQYFIHDASKTYSESEYPPKTPIPLPRTGPDGAVVTAHFEKSGASRTVAGYKCDEYTGVAQSPMGKMAVTMCVSKDAPGAAEVIEFEKSRVRLMKEVGVDFGPTLPVGVPLRTVTSMRSSAPDMSGVPPQVAERARAMLAKRAPMDSTAQVVAILVKKLPPETFQVPADYKRSERRAPPLPPEGVPAR
jgi:hypothetical protein